jgi:hypothetical protein
MEFAGTLLTILTPLVAVPLTVITFYLRSLREHQVSRHADLARRVEVAESNLSELRQMLAEFERDYTTKEEWLRECMLARRSLEHLHEAAVRMDTTVRELRRYIRPQPREAKDGDRITAPRPCADNHARRRDEGND